MSASTSMLELPHLALIVLYVAAAGGAQYRAFKRPASIRMKTIAIAAALALLGVTPGTYASRTLEQYRSRAEFENYRKAAWAHFKKRCAEDAGEKIIQTVDDVHGIFLERPRQRPTEAQLQDQYWMGDPYALVVYPPVEISRYLYDLDQRGLSTTRRTSRRGFDYVVVPQKNGKFLEYRLDRTNDHFITKELDTQPSRYSVTWQDISTQEDRKYWVAGGRLQVFDRQSNKLLGERIGYVFEQGFGATGGGRRPWLIAQHNACPPIQRNVAMDRLFVDKVLRRGNGGQNSE